MVLRKSRSRGSSLSNRSKSCEPARGKVVGEAGARKRPGLGRHRVLARGHPEVLWMGGGDKSLASRLLLSHGSPQRDVWACTFTCPTAGAQVTLACFLQLRWKLLESREVCLSNPPPPVALYWTRLKAHILSRWRRSGACTEGRGARAHALEGGQDGNFRDSQQGQTSGRYTSWLCLAGNQETQGNVRRTHTRAVGDNEHPLRGRSPRAGRFRPPRLQVSERPIPCSQGPPAPSLRYLQMGPGSFQGGLILFRVKLGPGGV